MPIFQLDASNKKHEAYVSILEKINQMSFDLLMPNPDSMIDTSHGIGKDLATSQDNLIFTIASAILVEDYNISVQRSR